MLQLFHIALQRVLPNFEMQVLFSAEDKVTLPHLVEQTLQINEQVKHAHKLKVKGETVNVVFVVRTLF